MENESISLHWLSTHISILAHILCTELLSQLLSKEAVVLTAAINITLSSYEIRLIEANCFSV